MAKARKALDIYTNEKIPRVNKIYRNQSMHITRNQSLD